MKSLPLLLLTDSYPSLPSIEGVVVFHESCLLSTFPGFLHFSPENVDLRVSAITLFSGEGVSSRFDAGRGRRTLSNELLREKYLKSAFRRRRRDLI